MEILSLKLAEYYLHEALVLSERSMISKEIALAEKLRVWLFEKHEDRELLPSDIAQRGPSSLREAGAAKKAISTLVEFGWLVPLEPGAKVRGSVRVNAYKVVRT